MPRPSGLLILDDGPLLEVITHVEKRGRINVVPTWRQHVGWLAHAKNRDVEGLMVFEEPGVIAIHEWAEEGPKIQQRYRELASSEDEDRFEALRWIQTRYRRVMIPAKDRPSLGDAGLAHLGYPIERGNKLPVYVWLYPDHFKIAAPAYRQTVNESRDSRMDDML